MFELVVRSGSAAGLRVEVAGDVVLGREGADVILSDPEASRHHAVVRLAAGGLEIEDLGSTNGTFVDQVRISGPTRLTAGARIRIGASEIQVQTDEVVSETVISAIPAVSRGQATKPLTVPTSLPQMQEVTPADDPELQPTAELPIPQSPHQVEKTMSSRAPAMSAQPWSPASTVPAGSAGGRPGSAALPRLGRADTRRLGPTVVSFGLIVLTAVALILYFLFR
jgi:predicted component of type VI protein secretion system